MLEARSRQDRHGPEQRRPDSWSRGGQQRRGGRREGGGVRAERRGVGGSRRRHRPLAQRRLRAQRDEVCGRDPVNNSTGASILHLYLFVYNSIFYRRPLSGVRDPEGPHPSEVHPRAAQPAH